MFLNYLLVYRINCFNADLSVCTVFCSNTNARKNYYVLFFHYGKKGKSKVQGVPQSETAAFPRPQEEWETDKNKQA